MALEGNKRPLGKKKTVSPRGELPILEPHQKGRKSESLKKFKNLHRWTIRTWGSTVLVDMKTYTEAQGRPGGGDRGKGGGRNGRVCSKDHGVHRHSCTGICSCIEKKLVTSGYLVEYGSTNVPDY